MALLNPPLGNITPYYNMGKPLENLVKALFSRQVRATRHQLNFLLGSCGEIGVLPASMKNFAAGGAAYDRNASKCFCRVRSSSL